VSTERLEDAPGERRPAPAWSLTFVGTATTVLRLGSFTLLTDPNFLHRGQRAYLGKGLWSRRLTDPSMTVDQVPELDAVVLSHLHGDHFDRVARRGLDRRYPVLTTPAAAGRLRSWGFDASGLETWQTRTFERPGERLTLSALPGVHARGLLRPLLPPVMGSLLEHEGRGRRHRVYVTGDTLTGPHLDDIRRRFEPIDTVVAHLGGTRVLFHTVTMDAPQGVQLLRQVPAARVVPVHYDDYRVFRSRVEDFVDLMGRQDLGTEVVVPARGETVDL
jgi:L-ascorbate metabolism protein UlaG (beta-lactamase superfamily)